MSSAVRNQQSAPGSERIGSCPMRAGLKWVSLLLALIAGSALALVAIGTGSTKRFLRFESGPSETSAEQFASYWMERLQSNDLLTGLVLTLPPDERPPVATDLRVFFASDAERRLAVEAFNEDRLVRMLRTGGSTRITFTRIERFLRSRGDAWLWYRIEYIDPEKKHHRVRVELQLRYAFGKSVKREGWWIRRVVFPLAHDYVLRSRFDNPPRLIRAAPLGTGANSRVLAGVNPH